MTKKHRCIGCRDNFYNQPGNSPSGECWLLKHAKLVKRVQVGTWDPPPYERIVDTVLECYRPQGYSMLSPDDPRVKSK